MKPKRKTAVRKVRRVRAPQKRVMSIDGEINKPLLITIIAVVAIAALSLLLVFSDQLAGRAFYTGTAGSAGIVAPAQNPQPNTPFDLTVRANLREPATAVVFELSFPEQLSCQSVESLIFSGSTSLVYSTAECDNVNHKVHFDYTTIDPAEKLEAGEVSVATITFVADAEGSYDLAFPDFTIPSFVDLGNLVSSEAATVEVAVPESLQPLCGNAVIEGDEDCDAGDQNGVLGDCPPGSICNYCTADCQEVTVEPGLCGNSVLDAGETCDDGNSAATDGCSAVCQVEEGYACEQGSTGVSTCVLAAPEQCVSDAACGGQEATFCIPPPQYTTSVVCVEQEPGCFRATQTVCPSGCDAATGQCQAAVVSPLDIEVLSNGVEVQGTDEDPVKRGTTYTIKVTLRPEAAVPDHIILAQVSYGGEPLTFFSDRKSSLAAGGNEVVEFVHNVPADAEGRMTVQAFVWNKVLSEGVTDWADIEAPLEVNYALGN
ncbi:hypothetical protein COV20_02580 [Candidatus Woesearchaeota archaeon CG10_big_fil_rev_8_21_14_0_10_45_16]|nr:MAG: hypothetical protein COV20_02580 [Candidatus Woesearchaeota archaeon CG10_big_fil_rev_8_21_14_0_10_45_16]